MLLYPFACFLLRVILGLIVWISVSWTHDKNVIVECRKWASLRPPVEDIFNDLELNNIKKCNAYDLYYGITDHFDYQKARICAIKNKSYEILSLLYANGKKVKRNVPLAIHYICLSSIADVEKKALIKELKNLNNTGDSQGDFNGCDAKNEMESTICWGNEFRRLSFEEDFIYHHLGKKFLSMKKKFLGFLEIKYYLYVNSRAYYEFEDKESMSIKSMLLEEIKIRRSYISLLEQMASCKVLLFTEQEYKDADKTLNSLYSELRHSKAYFTRFDSKARLNKLEEIKQTEIYWIRYKEAMMALSSKSCPTMSSFGVGAILTQERIAQLNDLKKRFN